MVIVEFDYCVIYLFIYLNEHRLSPSHLKIT